MIPKSNSDNTNPSNFRPISLLNVDVLAKVLSSRLKQMIGVLVEADRVGFIPRQAGM